MIGLHLSAVIFAIYHPRLAAILIMAKKVTRKVLKYMSFFSPTRNRNRNRISAFRFRPVQN